MTDSGYISTANIEWDEPAGELSVVPVDESNIEEDDRIPRVTSATWKYETGAVGSLTHALVLQGTKYSCELEVCKQYFPSSINGSWETNLNSMPELV
jgi:hypothetical protein